MGKIGVHAEGVEHGLGRAVRALLSHKEGNEAGRDYKEHKE